jgi:hypothetical protein
MDRRMVIIAVAAALIVTESVSADLMPLATLAASCQGGGCDCSQPVDQQARLPDLFGCGFHTIDLSSSPMETFPEPRMGSGKVSETQRHQGLTDGSDSFDLCLFALLGLGVCHSGHWVRKSSLGFVPDWYHNGGPFQIGHSLAVSPEILCPAPVYCFVQPDSAGQDALALSRPSATTALGRTSQFTPTVLAARGPPARNS